jgi:phosphonate transport system substrate-binding protein
MKKVIVGLMVVVLAMAMLAGCGKSQQAKKEAAIGSAERPIVMALVPSLDTQKLVKDGEVMAKLLEEQTGLKFKIEVPTSYTAVVTAMGAGKVDVGWLSPIPYVIAHDKYGVRVILTSVRDNSPKYWSFIIARKDSGIKSLADLKGKKFAYGDPMSTSGTIYPKHLIRTSGYDPEKFFANVLYAGAHDKVVMAVYNKQVDAGAIYGGVVSDARLKVKNMIPDVLDKTVVIAKSAEIPNDTVSVSKNLPNDIVKKVKDGLMNVAASDKGREAIMTVYGIDGFIQAKDAAYDPVRKVAADEGIKLEQFK